MFKCYLYPLSFHHHYYYYYYFLFFIFLFFIIIIVMIWTGLVGPLLVGSWSLDFFFFWDWGRRCRRRRQLTMMCGALSSTVRMAMMVKSVKMMRQTRSTTMAANFQSSIMSFSSSLRLMIVVMKRNSRMIDCRSRWACGARSSEAKGKKRRKVHHCYLVLFAYCSPCVCLLSLWNQMAHCICIVSFSFHLFMIFF